MGLFDNRPAQQRRKLGARMCVGSEVLGVAGCIAVVVLLPSVLTAVYMTGFAALYSGYNLFLWRSIDSQTRELRRESSPTS
jgi:hypothetical protein